MPAPFAQITPHLWAAQSELYTTNTGVWASQGEACLIDPGIFPREIRAIAEWLSAQHLVPRAIVLTHGHWDHIMGPEQFPGVPVIAQETYPRETTGQRGAYLQKQIDQWASQYEIARPQPFVIPTADRTFGDTMRLSVGDLQIELIHAPGHAADELVIYDDLYKTLWAGDMLSDLEIPFVIHSLSAYEHTLAKLSDLDIRVLIPGHGHVTTAVPEIRTRISQDIAYLAELRARVEQALAAGRTVQETVTACADMSYRHPKDNARSHRLNVESAYVELGGDADPSQIGWGQFI